MLKVRLLFFAVLRDIAGKGKRPSSFPMARARGTSGSDCAGSMLRSAITPTPDDRHQ